MDSSRLRFSISLRPGLPRRGQQWTIGRSDECRLQWVQLVCRHKRYRRAGLEFPFAVPHHLPFGSPRPGFSVALPLGINGGRGDQQNARGVPRATAVRTQAIRCPSAMPGSAGLRPQATSAALIWISIRRVSTPTTQVITPSVFNCGASRNKRAAGPRWAMGGNYLK